MKRWLFSLLLVIVVLGAAPRASLATPYPERPVKLVVPFAPGATTDILARMLAEKLSERWKQPVVVENRAGAGSIIGADFVAKSPPDGYTLLFGSESLALLPQIQDVPFDWRSDLALISKVGALPILFLATAKRADLSSLREFLAVAKQQPGKLNYGSPGNGTVHHLTTELFARAAGIELTHVPYKGAAPALNDLIGGTIDVMVGAETSAKPHIQAGRVRALAVFAKERLPGLPEVPTAAEAGQPFEMSFWWGVMAPGKTPQPVQREIESAVVATLRDADMRRRMLESGLTPVGSTAEEFARFFKDQYDGWARIVPSLQGKLK